MDYPAEFLRRMEQQLDSEFPQFLKSLDEPATRAVRVLRFQTHRAHASLLAPLPTAPEGASNNQCPPRRTPHSGPPHSPFWIGCQEEQVPVPEDLAEQLGDSVPWDPHGHYITPDSRLGKSVYHHIGSIYLQEPSAMAVAAVVAPKPGETILDLCAAPGGKSVALGQAAAGGATLVCNEIHPTRVLTLAENLERCGIPATITQASPAELATAWPGLFDAVLVDAPCSGEGMFRKSFEARQEWHPDAPLACQARQFEILESAVQLLRPGSRLVYSTCTFSPEENEQVVAWLVERFELEILPLSLPGWSEGRPDFANGLPQLRFTQRLWPHRARGEGHYVALLRVPPPSETIPDSRTSRIRHGETGLAQASRKHPSRKPQPKKAQAVHSSPPVPATAWKEFWNEMVATPFTEDFSRVVWQGDVAFTVPQLPEPEAPIRILRKGLPIATYRHQRLLPHHALARALACGAAARHIPLHLADAREYLHGNALANHARAANGIALLTWNDCLPLGFGKVTADRINNLYPKGLRTDHLE